jgi:hypothetical protein
VQNERFCKTINFLASEPFGKMQGRARNHSFKNARYGSFLEYRDSASDFQMMCNDLLVCENLQGVVLGRGRCRRKFICGSW